MSCIEAMLELAAVRQGIELIQWHFINPIIHGIADENCEKLLTIIRAGGVQAMWGMPRPHTPLMMPDILAP